MKTNLWERICILTFFRCLLLYGTTARSCSDEFSVKSLIGTIPILAPVGEPNSTQSITDTIPESTSEKENIYIITWEDPLLNSPSVDQSFILNMNYDSGEETVSVFLNESIIGLPDYKANQLPRDSIDMTIEFEFDVGLSCELYLIISISDNNTQQPFFLGGQDFMFEIIETFPLHTEISIYQFEAVDYDAESPNNMFEVIVDENCPLEAVTSSYQSIEGNEVTVAFQLASRLDYETMVQMFCNITLQDYGTPQLSTTEEFVINILPDDDENPEFTSNFYAGTLTSTSLGTEVITEPPIKAEDKDNPPKDVFYFMTVGMPSNGLDYFGINSETGVVSVIQELDGEFLANGDASFLLQATDAGGQNASATFLGITLPTIITTTEANNFNTSSTSETQVSHIEFQVNGYVFQVLPNQYLIGTITAIYDGGSAVSYSWKSNETTGSNIFDLNEITGRITSNETVQIRSFFLTALAETTEGLSTETSVDIYVLEDLSKPSALMDNSVIYAHEFPENTLSTEFGPVAIVNADFAEMYCLTAAEPPELLDHFVIGEYSGIIEVNETLDADNTTLGNKVTLKAVALMKNESCEQSWNIPSKKLLRNEALVLVPIGNLNENSPKFIVSPIDQQSGIVTFAYPSEVNLQRAVGSVASFQVVDLDQPEDFTGTYTLTPLEQFRIDGSTGIVYLVGELDVGQTFQMVVSCHDVIDGEDWSDSLIFNVVGINTDLIYTLYMDDVEMTHIDSTLADLSVEIGVNVRQLYSTVVSSVIDPNVASSRDEDTFALPIEVNVYAETAGVFLTLDEFQMKLQDAGSSLGVSVFTDDAYFDQSTTPPTDSTGLKVAVGILGAVVCLEIVLLAVFLGLKMYKRRHAVPRETKNLQNINTLGKAYENHNYQPDEEGGENFATIFGSADVENKSQNSSFRGEIAHEGNSLSSVQSKIFPVEISSEITNNDTGNLTSYYEQNQRETSSNRSSPLLYPKLDVTHLGKAVISKENGSYSISEKSTLSITEDIILAEVHHRNTEKYDSEGLRGIESEQESVIFPPILTNEILERKMSKKKSPDVESESNSDAEQNEFHDDKRHRNHKNVPSSTELDSSDMEKKSVAFKVLVETVLLTENEDDKNTLNEVQKTSIFGDYDDSEEVRL